MKTFISTSFGVESTAMNILYGKGATAIWCDTGDEEDVMYERIDKVETKLKEIHNGDWNLVRIYPEVLVKGEICRTIDEAALQWKFFPSPVSRWCTGKFKIEPIEKYLKEQGECELLIGFNADEIPGEDRVGNINKLQNVKVRYRLIEDGIYRDDCENLLKDYGLETDFPPYMQRGGCRKCFFKKKGELKAKAIFNPAGFTQDMMFEMQLQDKRNKFYNINMNAGGSYGMVEREVDREIAMWGIDAVKEMYSKVESHKPCGAFCHR